ncbi:fibronectin type III domain-containing protein [Candidatus Dojkabacteria bacterium]|nr:fibronectin type III domain-containing protein [Candidatus Dojkabacteria bacterium]
MKKFIPWIIIILLAGVLGLGFYYLLNRDVTVLGTDPDNIESIRPRNMRITQVDANSFTVEWKTSSAVVGYVKYGESSDNIVTVVQGDYGVTPKKDHKVKVSGLVKGKKYYFWVVSNNIAFGKDGRALEVLTIE